MKQNKNKKTDCQSLWILYNNLQLTRQKTPTPLLLVMILQGKIPVFNLNFIAILCRRSALLTLQGASQLLLAVDGVSPADEDAISSSVHLEVVQRTSGCDAHSTKLCHPRSCQVVVHTPLVYVVTDVKQIVTSRTFPIQRPARSPDG